MDHPEQAKCFLGCKGSPVQIGSARPSSPTLLILMSYGSPPRATHAALGPQSAGVKRREGCDGAQRPGARGRSPLKDSRSGRRPVQIGSARPSISPVSIRLSDVSTVCASGSISAPDGRFPWGASPPGRLEFASRTRLPPSSGLMAVAGGLRRGTILCAAQFFTLGSACVARRPFYAAFAWRSPISRVGVLRDASSAPGRAVCFNTAP